jgi:hypothetical protein
MTLYDDIARQTRKLTREEQLQLIAYLAGQARQTVVKPKPKRYWREIRGAASYPLGQEDAQDWIFHHRKESDKARGQIWES